MSFLLIISCRNHYFLKRLAHFYIHLTAQGQDHRCNLLRHIHACLKVLVYKVLVCFRESGQMYRTYVVASSCTDKVHIQTV